jgi:hypothetical protein
MRIVVTILGSIFFIFWGIYHFRWPEKFRSDLQTQGWYLYIRVFSVIAIAAGLGLWWVYFHP